MSIIDLEDAREFLNVFHRADDAKIQQLLEGAEQDALNIMDRTEFSSLPCDPESSSEMESDAGMPGPVRTACLYLLQASYQAPPDDIKKLREAAVQVLAPYRCKLGA